MAIGAMRPRTPSLLFIYLLFYNMYWVTLKVKIYLKEFYTRPTPPPPPPPPPPPYIPLEVRTFTDIHVHSFARINETEDRMRIETRSRGIKCLGGCRQLIC